MTFGLAVFKTVMFGAGPLTNTEALEMPIRYILVIACLTRYIAAMCLAMVHSVLALAFTDQVNTRTL